MARTRTAKSHQPPGPIVSDQEQVELDARLARMVSKPNKSDLGNGRFFLLWMQRDDSGAPRVMMWNPETEQEIRGANLFFEAAHGLGAFAKKVKRGKPIRRTTEEAALIAGVLANRDDDTGYLVYADYLTENGRSQGDFIRLCVETEKLPSDSAEATEKNQRRNELCAAHAEEWFAPLGELGPRPEFYGSFIPWAWLSPRYGVIEEVTIDRQGILPHNANRLFAAAPFLRKLKVERGHLDPAGLAKVRQLSQIEDLDLGHTDLTADGLRALLRSNYLTTLNTLRISNNAIGDAGAEALAAWPGLANLEALDVLGCELSTAGVSTLRHAPVTNLLRLNIGRNAPDPLVAHMLFTAQRLNRLTELELSGVLVDPSIAPGFGTAAFAKTLTHLDLDSATFQLGAFYEFARCQLPALRSLRLNNVNIPLADADALGRASFVATLEELHLDNCGLGAGLSNMLWRGRFPKLTMLDLSRNRLGRNGASALAGYWGRVRRVTNLRLWDNNLNGPAIAQLAGSRLFANLTDLDLSGNKIAQVGAVALANSKYLKKLTALVVDEAAVGERGKKALLARFGEDVVSFR